MPGNPTTGPFLPLARSSAPAAPILFGAKAEEQPKVQSICYRGKDSLSMRSEKGLIAPMGADPGHQKHRIGQALQTVPHPDLAACRKNAIRGSLPPARASVSVCIDADTLPSDGPGMARSNRQATRELPGSPARKQAIWAFFATLSPGLATAIFPPVIEVCNAAADGRPDEAARLPSSGASPI